MKLRILLPGSIYTSTELPEEFFLRQIRNFPVHFHLEILSFFLFYASRTTYSPHLSDIYIFHYIMTTEMKLCSTISGDSYSSFNELKYSGDNLFAAETQGNLGDYENILENIVSFMVI